MSVVAKQPQLSRSSAVLRKSEKGLLENRMDSDASRQLWALERQLCPFVRQKIVDFCLSWGHHVSIERQKREIKCLSR